MFSKEAIVCYYSEQGHRGFYYPSKIKGIIKQNSEYETVPWISGTDDGLIAIKIQKKNILPLTLDEEKVKILLSKQHEKTIVWIDK
jgi:hypothetical protein